MTSKDTEGSGDRRIKVLLVGNYLADGQQSMQRYASLLENCLSSKCVIKTIRPKVVFGALPVMHRGIRKWLAYVDKYCIFPFVLMSKARAFDVVHICDQANATYVWYLRKTPHIVTCHDVTEIRSALGLDPNHRPGRMGRLFHRLNLRGLLTATGVVCVSEATRRALTALAEMPASRVSVILNCLNYPYRPMGEPEASHRIATLGVRSGTPFLLSVSGNQWYKNRMGLLAIFHSLRTRISESPPLLVIAGRPLTPELRREIGRLQLNDSVVSVPNVQDEDLRALYSAAQVLLFPSLQEGFGWPIIEAQACGCPVAASNVGPLPEVGGTAARYFYPQNIEAAVDVILSILNDRATLTAAGLVNARRFSVETDKTPAK